MRAYRVVSFALALALVSAAVALIGIPAGGAAARGVLIVLAGPAEASVDAQAAAETPAPAEARRNGVEEPASELPGVIIQPPAMTGEPQTGDGDSTGGAGEEAVSGADGAADEPDSGASPAEAPASGQQTTGDANRLTEVLAAYHKRIASLIEAQKRYPEIARRLKHEGMARVRFRLSAKGKLLSSAVDTGSGYAELDEAALEAVRSVARFPPFPHPLGAGERDFVVTLNFTLK